MAGEFAGGGARRISEVEKENLRELDGANDEGGGVVAAVAGEGFVDEAVGGVAFGAFFGAEEFDEAFVVEAFGEAVRAK